MEILVCGHYFYFSHIYTFLGRKTIILSQSAVTIAGTTQTGKLALVFAACVAASMETSKKLVNHIGEVCIPSPMRFNWPALSAMMKKWSVQKLPMREIKTAQLILHIEPLRAAETDFLKVNLNSLNHFFYICTLAEINLVLHHIHCMQSAFACVFKLCNKNHFRKSVCKSSCKQ